MAGQPVKVPVQPLYTAASAAGRSAYDLSYSVRRLPRRRSAEERRFRQASDYTGTEMFLSLGETAASDDAGRVSELSVKALCSNRHLTEQLPVGEGGADFRFIDDVSVDIHCLAGPTRPWSRCSRRSHGKTDRATTSKVAWRLVDMLTSTISAVQRGAARADSH